MASTFDLSDSASSAKLLDQLNRMRMSQSMCSLQPLQRLVPSARVMRECGPLVEMRFGQIRIKEDGLFVTCGGLGMTPRLTVNRSLVKPQPSVVRRVG